MVSQRLLTALAAAQVFLAASAMPVSDATPDWIAVHPASRSAAAEKAVRDYWTVDRIANIDASKLIPNAPPIPEDVWSLGREFPSKGAILTTVGRLFYTVHLTTNSTADNSCTGTLVESANGATIITAAHCVHAGGGNPIMVGFHDNILFVPGWKDGERPFGTFTANGVVVANAWIDESTFEDRAIIVLNAAEDGRQPRDVLGKGQKMRFDNETGVGVERWLLGYSRYVSGSTDVPQEGTPAFTGNRLASCNGTAVPWAYGHGLSGLQCRGSGGASGGPHFMDLDLETGRGTLIAVNNIVDVVGDDNLPASFAVNATDARTEALLKAAGAIDISYA